jgi:hypothetical protein
VEGTCSCWQYAGKGGRKHCVGRGGRKHCVGKGGRKHCVGKGGCKRCVGKGGRKHCVGQGGRERFVGGGRSFPFALWDAIDGGCTTKESKRSVYYLNFFLNLCQGGKVYRIGRRFFGTFCSFAYCSRQRKIYPEIFFSLKFRPVSSSAASCEGRTFYGEKGWRAACCDGVKMQKIMFQFLLNSVQKLCNYHAPSFLWLHGDRRGGTFGRPLFDGV